MVFNGVALDEALGDLIFEGKGHSYKIENVNMERMEQEYGVNWLYRLLLPYLKLSMKIGLNRT